MSYMKPFTSRNEGEWTRYLETVLQREKAQLKVVLNDIADGVAIIGQDRTIQYMNPSLVRDFGEGTGEYCYKHFYQISEPCNPCQLSSVVHGITEKLERSFSNGNTYNIIYSPFTNAEQTLCALITFINVTKRKQFDLELVKLNNLKTELLKQKEARLQQISREMVNIKDEKKRFIGFLGVVAHDLKSPLSVSQSILTGISEGYYGPVSDEQKAMIDRVNKRIDNLNTLIDDLIDIPLIETGQMVREMTEISLSDIIKTSVNEFNILAVEKGVQLGLRLPANLPGVFGSGRHLQQVMNNLLSNAVKYSVEGAILVIVSEDNNYIKVEVSDNGIGIQPDDLPNMFEDFFRGKNRGTIKGTGLGLSISRRIIEAHDGKIWAESPNPDTNSGSKFTFTIPKILKK